MALPVGTIADAVVKSPFAHTGYAEGVSRNLAIFNQLSNGTIRLMDPVNRPGYVNDLITFGTFEGFATRHKVASGGALASADVKKMVDIQARAVKLNHKIVVYQDEQFFKKGASGLQGGADELRPLLEQNFVGAALTVQVNDAINAAVASLRSQSTNVKDVVTGAASAALTKITPDYLNDTLAKLGDQRGRVRCLVMHSESYRQLIGNALGASVTGISDFTLREGIPQTFGIPTLVTDAPGLTSTSWVSSAGSSAEYAVLALVENAVELTVTEEYMLDITKLTGQEIPSYEMFGRWAHELRIKGLSWKTSSADNPTTAQLGTASSWELKATSYKTIAGAVLIHG